MAIYLFADKIKKGEKIPVFNYGKMQRDFTYIDDIVNGIMASLEKNYSFEIFNLGNNRSEDLMGLIKYLEIELNKTANIEFLELQPGDVEVTYANIDHAKEN